MTTGGSGLAGPGPAVGMAQESALNAPPRPVTVIDGELLSAP